MENKSKAGDTDVEESVPSRQVQSAVRSLPLGQKPELEKGLTTAGITNSLPNWPRGHRSMTHERHRFLETISAGSGSEKYFLKEGDACVEVHVEEQGLCQ